MKIFKRTTYLLLILSILIFTGFSAKVRASEPAAPSISLPLGQNAEDEAGGEETNDMAEAEEQEPNLAEEAEQSDAEETPAREVKEMQRVYDQAGLFTAEEIEELEAQARDLYATHGEEIIVVTTDNTEGKSSENYAADFYDYLFDNTAYEDTSGVILLLDMDNRLVTAVNTGHMIDVINDNDVQNLTAEGAQHMKYGGYAQAARTMMARVDGYIRRGVVAGHRRVERPVDPGPNGITPEEAAVSGVAGLGTAASFYASQRKRYKGKKKPLRYNLHANRMISLLPFTDQLLDTRITSIPLPRQSQHFGGGDSGGPSSSTFTGSSGTTHSGGSSGF